MLQTFETVVINPVTAPGALREFVYSFAVGELQRIDIVTDNPTAAGVSVFDVLKNGATLFPGGVGRPEIATSAGSGNVSGLTVAVARGDKIRITAATVPGTIGGKLYIILTFDDGVAAGGGVLAGDVTGAAGANTATKIRNRLIDPMAIIPGAVSHDEYITWTNQFHLGDSGGSGGTGANGFIQSNQTYWWTAGADGNAVSTPGDKVSFWFTPIAVNAGGNYGLGAQAVNPAAQGGDINLRWHIKENLTCAVYENPDGLGAAIKTGYFSGITAATVFRIDVDPDGSVRYYLDGVLKYTSTIDPNVVKTWALRPQVSLGYYGGNSPEPPSANGYQGCTTAHIRIETIGVDPVVDGAGLYWSYALQKFEAALRLAGINIVGAPSDGAALIYVASHNWMEWRVIAPAVISGASEEDISYSGLTGSVSVAAGNKLTATANWDSITHNGARATQTLQAVGAYVKFRIQGAAANRTRYVGLRTSSPDHINANFDPYRIQIRDDGHIYVIENDVTLTDIGAYADNDLIEFRVEGTTAAPVLKVYQNGGLVSTYATAPTFPLYLDIELPFNATEIREGKIKRTA